MDYVRYYCRGSNRLDDIRINAGRFEMKYLITILGSIMTVFFAFFKGGEAAKNKIRAKLSERAREAEQMGYEAGIDGVEQEQKNQAEPIDTKKRDHFES